MAIKITDECINCGACEAECPNTAIYEGGLEWSFAEGTELSGKIHSKSGISAEADEELEPVSYDFYYIATCKDATLCNVIQAPGPNQAIEANQTPPGSIQSCEFANWLCRWSRRGFRPTGWTSRFW